MKEDYVKSYVRQNEDYSLGHSISDSSEKLLQRGRRESQYICDLGERGVCAIKNIFLHKVSAVLMKVSASHEEKTYHEAF